MPLRGLFGPRLTVPTQVAYINLAALRRFLAGDFERIVAALSPQQGEKQDEARRGLKEMSTVLELADSAAIAAQVEAGSIRISASIALDQPAH